MATITVGQIPHPRAKNPVQAQVAQAKCQRNTIKTPYNTTRNTQRTKVEMTCGGCSGAVSRILDKKEGIDKFEIDLPNKKVFVTSALPKDELLETIKKAGKATSYVGTA